MNNEFIPYEQALALRKLGFNEPCLGYYFGKDKKVYISNEYVKSPFTPKLDSKVMFRAPLYQQAIKFFREKYNIWIAVENLMDNKFYFSIRDTKTSDYASRKGCNEDGYESDNEAYEAAIKYYLINN